MNKEQTDIAVVQTLKEQKQSKGRRQIYKVEADAHKGELLAADLSRKIDGVKLAIKRSPVKWDDLAEVQRRSLEYLEMCRSSQTIPTISGLSVFGMGTSRQALNQYIREHRNTATAQFLQQMKDIFSDTIESAALNNYINSIMSIFILKNDYDRVDRVSIEAVPQNDSPLGEQVDAQTLQTKYQFLPED